MVGGGYFYRGNFIGGNFLGGNFPDTENLTFGNNRYKTKLPFKKYNEVLPDNFYLSKIRLNTLKTRWDKNENVMIEYDKIIKQYIIDGIVEPVHSTTTSYDLGSVHYLPHRAVASQNRDTTKLRIVFDASAHVGNEPSLKDVLYSGPCMLPLLHDILIRFRIGKIGIVADVQQALLQIEIDEKHRDFLRFIWFDNVLSNNPSYVLLRFARVVFGLTCSPLLLNGNFESSPRKVYTNRKLLKVHTTVTSKFICRRSIK